MRATIANLIHRIADMIGGLNSQAERETKERALNALVRIKDDSENTMAAIEAEANRRERMGLLSEKAPEQWRSEYYIRQGYRFVLEGNGGSDHWRGGRPRHDNPICPHCKTPLLTFFDIDCDDPQLREENAALFGTLKRVPLYYCCRRPEPTIYQLLDDGSIRMITADLLAWEESPFSKFPESFEKKSCKLVPIPRDIENLLVIATAFDLNWLNYDECQRLANYLGLDRLTLWFRELTQFGSKPLIRHNREGHDCPNKLCPTHQMGHPLLRNKSEYQMKELAVIADDAGFEMQMNGAQVAFYICWKCHTVQAEYQCT
jgi:hypothetical protein